jgi:hypothetical protein
MKSNLDHHIRELEKTSRALGWLLATLALLVVFGLVGLVATCGPRAAEVAPLETPSEAESDVTHLTSLYVSGDFQVGGKTQLDDDLSAQYPPTAKAASYTVLTQDSGTLFHNTGATAEITLTLPAAVPGLYYCFYVYAAYAITIEIDDADQVYHLTNAAGDRLQNAGTVGDNICLWSNGITYWLPMGEIGTWSDAN